MEEGSKVEHFQRLYDELLLFKEHLDEDLRRNFYLTVVEHVNNYNLFLQEMNLLSPKVTFGKIDPTIYQLPKSDEERMIERGIFNQYFGSILSTTSHRVDLWLLHLRNLLHLQGQKFVPDEVYEKLPTPIKKMMDEATGCYEHNYLTACSMMLRKILEDSIYLKFRIENKVDELYEKDKRHTLETMIQKSKELHYVSSQLANRLVTIKLFGDVSAHSFRVELHQGDIDRCIELIRLVLNELFYEI
jgi:hypothetical protein